MQILEGGFISAIKKKFHKLLFTVGQPVKWMLRETAYIVDFAATDKINI